MRSIILEGADHLGKSTFAADMINTYDPDNTYIRLAHMGIPHDEWNYASDYFHGFESENVIYDRFHLGGFVYGKLMRLHGTRYWTYEKLADIMKKLWHPWRRELAQVPTVIFYASDTVWFAKHLRESGKKEAFSVERILEVNEHYIGLIGMTFEGMPFAQYAWDVSGGAWPSAKEYKYWTI